jgi:hypothetical protein
MIDYLDKGDVMISDTLYALIDHVSEYEKEISLYEMAIKELKTKRDKILEDDIPAYLHENGLQYAPLADGRVVTIESIINVSQGDKELLRNWLEINGYDSVIKTEFQFPKGSDIAYFEKILKDEGTDYSKDITIHPITLKKVFRDHIEGGGEYPPEAAAKVSVFERAKIKGGE